METSKEERRAYLVKTLQKYLTNNLQRKSSSPKIIPLCPALCTFFRGEYAFNQEMQGRLFESVVGADLMRLHGEVFYWRQDQAEVDYVFTKGSRLFAIEVKSGRWRSAYGLATFKRNFPESICVTMTIDNYPEFLTDPLLFLNKVS